MCLFSGNGGAAWGTYFPGEDRKIPDWHVETQDTS